MLCILGSMQDFALFVAMTIALQEMVVIFAMHLLFAKLSKQAHQPAKRLLCTCARNQHRTGDFRGKLRMSFQIARLHTDKRFVYNI